MLILFKIFIKDRFDFAGEGEKPIKAGGPEYTSM